MIRVSIYVYKDDWYSHLAIYLFIIPYIYVCIIYARMYETSDTKLRIRRSCKFKRSLEALKMQMYLLYVRTWRTNELDNSKRKVRESQREGKRWWKGGGRKASSGKADLDVTNPFSFPDSGNVQNFKGEILSLYVERRYSSFLFFFLSFFLSFFPFNLRLLYVFSSSLCALPTLIIFLSSWNLTLNWLRLISHVARVSFWNGVNWKTRGNHVKLVRYVYVSRRRN